MKTGYKITLGAAACCASAIAFLAFPIRSIEGIWRSPFHVNCLCSSYDFVEFKDGIITRYSDKHESVMRAGHYSSRTDGRFNVVFNRDAGDSLNWVVQPRILCWFAPLNHLPPGTAPPGSDRLICRLFYRPFSTRRAEQIIAEGLRKNSMDISIGKVPAP